MREHYTVKLSSLGLGPIASYRIQKIAGKIFFTSYYNNLTFKNIIFSLNRCRGGIYTRDEPYIRFLKETDGFLQLDRFVL